MREHKTIKDGYTWVPPDKRRSRYGGTMPPRKPESRLPILWLARDGNELYLVNASNDTLEYVFAGSGGFQTADDDVVTVSNKEQYEYKYEYKYVNPDEAVKVEEYDGFYDLDYVLQVHLEVKSPSLGCIEIVSPSKKGGVCETVLLWSSGEPGKQVSIKNSSKPKK